MPITERERLQIIRNEGCCVPITRDGLMRCRGTPVELHHVRTAANSGVGMKPNNSFILCLCADHHRIGHLLGWTTFEKTYGIDLAAEAKKMAKIKSPMP